MKRRDFVTSVFVGGLATPVIGGQHRVGEKDKRNGKGKEKDEKEEHHGEGHGHGKRDERLNNVTVSFGHWLPTPDYPAVPAEVGTGSPQPIDRFLTDPNPRFLNGHVMIPNTVRICVGETVSFIIAGFHLVLIYGPGTEPHEIDRTKLLVSPPMTFPPLIDDPHNRLYRGLDPRTQATQDRVEVVGFNTPGKYLAACGVLPHFFIPSTASFLMYGFVEVRDRDN